MTNEIDSLLCYMDRYDAMLAGIRALDDAMTAHERVICFRPTPAALAVSAPIEKLRAIRREIDSEPVPGAVRDDAPCNVRRPAFVEGDADDPDFGTVPHDAAMRWEAD